LRAGACLSSYTRRQDQRFLLLSGGRRAGLVSFDETGTGMRKRASRQGTTSLSVIVTRRKQLHSFVANGTYLSDIPRQMDSNSKLSQTPMFRTRSLLCSLSCTRSQDQRFLRLSGGRRAGFVSTGET
jgi:hypothetical protein